MPKPIKQTRTGSTRRRTKAPVKPLGKDRSSRRHLKCVTFGESGTGKTVFWGTFPKPIKVLLCSGGDAPSELDSLPPEWIEEGLVDPVVVSSVFEAEDIVEGDGLDGYKTVVLDHATGYQSIALKDVVGLTKVPREAKWGIADMQQWGQVNTLSQNMFQRLASLDKNVVVVCHERDFETEERASSDDRLSPHISVALTRGSASYLRGSFSYVLNTFIRQKQKVVQRKDKKGNVRERTIDVPNQVDFCMRIGPNSTYYTKFRRPVVEDQPELPPWIVNPSYQQIMDLIYPSK